MTHIHIEVMKGSTNHTNGARAFFNGEKVAEVEVRVNSAPICSLCRELIAKGYPEDYDVTITREGGDMVLFKPTTIGYWASKTITEGDTSIRLAKYTGFRHVERDNNGDE